MSHKDKDQLLVTSAKLHKFVWKRRKEEGWEDTFRWGCIAAIFTVNESVHVSDRLSFGMHKDKVKQLQF